MPKKKKKLKKLHYLPLMSTKITLTSLVFVIVKRPLFYEMNYNHISCNLKPLNQLNEF